MDKADQQAIMGAITDLRETVEANAVERKADNLAIWSAITDLRDTISTGKGAIRALVWVGGVIGAILALGAAWFPNLKH